MSVTHPFTLPRCAEWSALRRPAVLGGAGMRHCARIRLSVPHPKHLTQKVPDLGFLKCLEYSNTRSEVPWGRACCLTKLISVRRTRHAQSEGELYDISAPVLTSHEVRCGAVHGGRQVCAQVSDLGPFWILTSSEGRSPVPHLLYLPWVTDV